MAYTDGVCMCSVSVLWTGADAAAGRERLRCAGAESGSLLLPANGRGRRQRETASAFTGGRRRSPTSALYDCFRRHFRAGHGQRRSHQEVEKSG